MQFSFPVVFYGRFLLGRSHFDGLSHFVLRDVQCMNYLLQYLFVSRLMSVFLHVALDVHFFIGGIPLCCE